MKALKAVLDVVVLAYIAFTILLLTSVIEVEAMFEVSAGAEVLDIYKMLVAAGAGLMLVKLLVTNLYIADISRALYLAQLKINNLKADLYEKRQAFRSNSYKQAHVEETEAA
ncbi:hypothetical protein I2I11_17945 [Pontibacter sp. 172403-2]|uniref:hypothetical protein n=1 Tax=Pontibacter rufus TaxID=2791028 RepID=UPI0018AFF863|nr:hypothetical protein [Pontibacter sp. 172403-2]MBF9255185.1 hypothetical protein [Pontibacter sp. 172403-2]